jgi:hypothetical protein
MQLSYKDLSIPLLLCAVDTTNNQNPHLPPAPPAPHPVEEGEALRHAASAAAVCSGVSASPRLCVLRGPRTYLEEPAHEPLTTNYPSFARQWETKFGILVGICRLWNWNYERAPHTAHARPNYNFTHASPQSNLITATAALCPQLFQLPRDHEPLQMDYHNLSTYNNELSLSTQYSMPAILSSRDRL